MPHKNTKVIQAICRIYYPGNNFFGYHFNSDSSEGSEMKTKFAILKICFLISITFFPVADAGEIYRWVDENGVTRFSDSSTDRNALIRSNAKLSPSFERKTSSTGPEIFGIQNNDFSSQSK